MSYDPRNQRPDSNGIGMHEVVMLALILVALCIVAGVAIITVLVCLSALL